MRKLVSVVIPAYNESACVDELARRLIAVFDELADRYDFEAIICENGSADDTYQKLLAIRTRDPRFKIVQLARNFGTEGAVTAGLFQAHGDAAVIMNADLQDPPELMPLFLEQWERGYQNVYGIIKKRHGESWLRRTLTAGYYFLLHRASRRMVPEQVSDFRLVDRTAYEAFNRLGHRYGNIRAIWAWLGFTSIGIEHDREPRFGGRSTFNYGAAIRSATQAILGWSPAPLRWIPHFGSLLALFSFALLVASIVRAFVFGVPFNGFGTLVALNLLLFGLLFMFLGMVSVYLALIYDEVRPRPVFVVRARHGLEDRPAVDFASTLSDRPHHEEVV